MSEYRWLMWIKEFPYGFLPGMFLVSMRSALFLAILMLGSFETSVSLLGQKESGVTEGAALAAQHCASCHQFPAPDLLPKESWEYALTYMGFMMGIVDYSYMEGVEASTMDSIRLREELVRKANVFPEEPLLDEAQWRSLRHYYISNAPEQAIPQREKPRVVEDEVAFRMTPTQYAMEGAITSLTRIDETNGYVLVYDSRSEQLTVLNRKLEFHDRHAAPGVYLIDAEAKGNQLYLLSIGDLFAAHVGERYGELQRAKLLGGVYIGLEIVLKGLHRPADFVLADLNGDGLDDALISEFGDFTGSLSLYEGEGARGGFRAEPSVISEEPGIVKSAVWDFNGDGLLDVAALAGAGRENFSLFLNNGANGFERKTIVEAHPSFGYTSFALRDFNGDGKIDFMTINGDNGDSDPYNTLKRDHGIRIYLNRGDLEFEEAFFYPMYGVFGACVEDFDLDGDLDIAAIAYHPDFGKEKPENFVLLEQTSPLDFSPKTHPATYKGRWMTIDAGDIDGDGDKDIVLGAAYLPVGMGRHQERFEELSRDGPSLLALENLSVE